MNSIKQSWAVVRIIPNYRPINLYQNYSVNGELILKPGFASEDEAITWLQALPPDKIREGNYYEVKKVFTV
jgi:hypothetical protein